MREIRRRARTAVAAVATFCACNRAARRLGGRGGGGVGLLPESRRASRVGMLSKPKEREAARRRRPRRFSPPSSPKAQCDSRSTYSVERGGGGGGGKPRPGGGGGTPRRAPTRRATAPSSTKERRRLHVQGGGAGAIHLESQHRCMGGEGQGSARGDAVAAARHRRRARRARSDAAAASSASAAAAAARSSAATRAACCSRTRRGRSRRRIEDEMAPRTEEEISPLPSSASEAQAQRRFSVRSVPGGAAPSSAFKMASAPADPMPLCERSTDVRTPLVSARAIATAPASPMLLCESASASSVRLHRSSARASSSATKGRAARRSLRG